MRTAPVAGALLGACLAGTALPAGAQTPSAAECAKLRGTLGAHAQLSDGVRRAVAAHVARYPAAPPAAAAAPPSPAPSPQGAEAIRARLAQIPAERQRLEEQRLGAMVRLDFARANEAQSKITELDQERARLERELASAPTAPAAPVAPPPPTAPAPAAAQGSDASRVRCEDVRDVLVAAVRTRQRELGAREGQPGVLPLTALRGQSPDQIAGVLAEQFAPWPAGATQLGLLDVEGDGRLDGFVDMSADGVYRLHRQRSDGSVAVELFAVAGRATPSDLARRLEEETARRTGRSLADLLAGWRVGPVRTQAETGAFAATHAKFTSGEWAEAGRLDGAAARTVEYANFRGESIRLLEVFTSVPNGVAYRRVLVAPRPSDQEQWEELSLVVRPSSYWRTDVEVSLSRQLRTAAGAAVAGATATGPVKFSLER